MPKWLNKIVTGQWISGTPFARFKAGSRNWRWCQWGNEIITGKKWLEPHLLGLPWRMGKSLWGRATEQGQLYKGQGDLYHSCRPSTATDHLYGLRDDHFVHSDLRREDGKCRLTRHLLLWQVVPRNPGAHSQMPSSGEQEAPFLQ